MLTTIVIGTTGYSSNGTAYSGFAGAGGTVAWGDARLFNLVFKGDDEGYPTLEFTVFGCGPAIPFPPGMPAQLVTSNDDGSSPVLRFSGDLQEPGEQPSQQGPAWGYLCTDLKRRADHVTLLSSAGLAVASYNLSPNDEMYLFTLAGRTVGQIIIDVLQSPSNAAVLSGLGIGNYTVVSGVYTLPAQTLTDLAALYLVPPGAVNLSGECILNNLEAFLQELHQDFTLYVEPGGTIRVISIFGRTAHAFTLDSATAIGDPVDSLSYKISLDGCFGAVQVIGQDIAGFVASYADGTLTHAAAAPSSPPWTIADFNTPANGVDQGVSSGVTSTSCTVHSDQATTHWIANFWNNGGGVIVLYDLSTTGVDQYQVRQVTSCTAMSAGGTATITWDTTLPLPSTGYTRYRLFATNTPRSLWDREFYVTDPSSGATGLSTWVGSHMYPVFPFGFPWGNLGREVTAVATIRYPTAKVQWSPTGAYPWFEMPIVVTLNPAKGTVVLSQPAVLVSANLAGQAQALANGYPATTFMGLWHDIQVAIPYNRGQIKARYPTSGFAGTAYTKYGRSYVKTIALSGYVWNGDTAALTTLAHEHLKAVQDASVSGTIRLLWDDWTPTFDPLTIGYAININTPGAASDIDGLDLPVRSFVMEWPKEGASIRTLTFTFNNKHRQFQGDPLYTHPAFSGEQWGTQGGLFIGGEVGGMSGSQDFGSLPGMASQSGYEPDVADFEGGDVAGGDFGPTGEFRSGMEGRAGRQKALRDKNEPDLGPAIDPDKGEPSTPPAPRPGSLRERRGGTEEPPAPPPEPPPQATPPPAPPRRKTLREKRESYDEEGG